MTLRDLINLTRARLDDSTLPYLWSDLELTQIINDRINELCEKVGMLKDDYTSSICTIPIISGTQLYSLDPRIVKILSVKIGSTYKQLNPQTRAFLNTTHVGWEAFTGSPKYFILDVPNRLRLYPIPTANDTLYMYVVRYPLVPLSLVSDTLSPEIDSKYHMRLIDGILASAYTKQDSETLDLIKSQLHDRKWIKDIDDIQMVEAQTEYYGLTISPPYGCI